MVSRCIPLFCWQPCFWGCELIKTAWILGSKHIPFPELVFQAKTMPCPVATPSAFVHFVRKCTHVYPESLLIISVKVLILQVFPTFLDNPRGKKSIVFRGAGPLEKHLLPQDSSAPWTNWGIGFHQNVHSFHMFLPSPQKKLEATFSETKWQWIPFVSPGPGLERCTPGALEFHSWLHDWRKTPADPNYQLQALQAVGRRCVASAQLRSCSGVLICITPWVLRLEIFTFDG